MLAKYTLLSENRRIITWQEKTWKFRYGGSIHFLLRRQHNIGEKRLRQIIKDNPVADYLLWNGTHVLIKRKLFEQYIDIVEAV